ncbi:MAG: YfhO family protein [Oscillospiraceae bacterium]|nr:YfhO family protein [Oscillospiraceae bacterium]
MKDSANRTDSIETAGEKEKDSASVQEELRKINDIADFEDVDGGSGNLTVNLFEKESAGEIEKNISDPAQAKKMRYLPVHILAFAIPFVLMGIAYSTIKIFPFGERQIMVVDSWHQYYPFLQELRHKLTSGGSLLYSWNTGAGTNFLALMSYYASTPIYIFSVFFPEKYLREFMMLATIVKISCSGLFFSIYLRGLCNNANEEKKHCLLNKGFAIIGFSVLYAVSAYAVGYYWCIMWLDCMALLPLVILGLERLIDSRKFKLYIIALGVTVVCNYYAAIFVCEFVAVYYIILYITKIKKPSVWGFVTKTAEAVGASIVGVGLSMFILLPTFLWFANTGNAGSTFSRDFATYNSILDIITNLLPNTTPAVRAGLPNIACGLLTVVMAGMYFLNSKIQLKEKLAAGAFLVFMLFSFNLNILDYYWHGMHFPNEIPYRQAFVFTFVLVTLAYKSYMSFDGESIKKGTVLKFLLCVFGYLIIAEQWYKTSDKKDVFDFKVFYVAVAVLVVYMVVILLYKHGKMSKTYLAVILMFAMIFEGGMSAIKGAATTGTSDRNSYPPSKESVRKAVENIYETDEDLFFRLEMSLWYSTNDPALYRYRGISQFSSEANSRFAKTLEIFGIAATIPSNRFLYSSATPVFNTFMSIKYLMAREESLEYNVDSVVFDEMPELRQSVFEVLELEDGGESFTDEKQVVNVYQNKYWLPLGFIVSEDIKEVGVGEQNIFAFQNELMKKATGITGNIFENIEQTRNSNENFSESRSKYGVYSYQMTDKSKKGTVNHVYTSDIYQQVYMYIKSTRSKNAYVSINGVSKKYEINRGITIDCGTVHAGQEISVNMDIDPSESGTFYIFAAGFDEQIFKNAYDILKAKSLDIEKFSDTNIKGKVDAGEGGIFFTSIPYDKGWNLKIDGEKVEINPISETEINDVSKPKDDSKDKKKNDIREIKKITDGFITAPIEGGEHTIELYYITEGLIPGFVISLSCIGILVIAELLVTRKRKKRRNAYVR